MRFQKRWRNCSRCNQCDQIGRFCKVNGNKFAHKSSPKKIGDFWANLKNCKWILFWQLLKTVGQLSYFKICRPSIHWLHDERSRFTFSARPWFTRAVEIFFASSDRRVAPNGKRRVQSPFSVPGSTERCCHLVEWIQTAASVAKQTKETAKKVIVAHQRRRRRRRRGGENACSPVLLLLLLLLMLRLLLPSKTWRRLGLARPSTTTPSCYFRGRNPIQYLHGVSVVHASLAHHAPSTLPPS